jgi:hypothetical protein
MGTSLTVNAMCLLISVKTVVFEVLCCGIPLLLLSGVSPAFLMPSWPVMGGLFAVVGVIGFIWYLKRGCAACPRNEGRCSPGLARTPKRTRLITKGEHHAETDQGCMTVVPFLTSGSLLKPPAEWRLYDRQIAGRATSPGDWSKLRHWPSCRLRAIREENQ